MKSVITADPHACVLGGMADAAGQPGPSAGREMRAFRRSAGAFRSREVPGRSRAHGITT